VKLTQHFSDFLDQTVNLNADRLNLLDQSVTAIKDFIRGSDWGPRIHRFTPQGSWAHKTIIKPVNGREFDADLLVMIAPYEDWEPKDYINELYRTFRASGVYKDKVRRYSHCVTIEYARERRIDVAPCIIVPGDDVNLVCNRNTNAFEPSRPEAYTMWIANRNGWTGQNGQKKATRLIKYLRDIKTKFTCDSILLTTLLGIHIFETDRDGDDFADAPTALRSVITRLDDTLQQYPSKPEVPNPVLRAEVFSDGWDETKYRNFREQIHHYRGWIDDAYLEPDRDASISKWRNVFGDQFAKDVVLTEAKSVTGRAIEKIRHETGTAVGLANDMVGLLVQFGARAIPAGLNLLPYVQLPTWRTQDPPSLIVRVTARLHAERGGAEIRPITDLTPLPKHRYVKFDVRNAMGGPLGNDYFVKWRVTNTDDEAANVGCLRGDFYKPDVGHIRWEKLEYRGLHFVEAFVIRKRDRLGVGKSEPFYVVID